MTDLHIDLILLGKIYQHAVQLVNEKHRSQINYLEFIKNQEKENILISVKRYFYDRKSHYESEQKIHLSKETNDKIESYNNQHKQQVAIISGIGAAGVGVGAAQLLDNDSSVSKKIVSGFGAAALGGVIGYYVSNEYQKIKAKAYYTLNPIIECESFNNYIYNDLLDKMKEVVGSIVSDKLIKQEQERKQVLYENQKKELFEKIKIEEENKDLNPDKILFQATKAIAKTEKKLTKLEVQTKELKKELKCPITGELFVYPVCAPDGHVYEQKSLQDHFQKQSTEISLGVYSRREFKFPACPQDMTRQLYNPADLSRDHNTHLKMNKYKAILEKKDYLKDKIENRKTFRDQLLEERENNKSSRAPEGNISIPM